jgi:RNA polymerase sigma-70 factor, ECF subfamily
MRKAKKHQTNANQEQGNELMMTTDYYNSEAALTNELSLLKQALTEADSFTPIYQHYYGRVYTYVRYRLQNVALAEDVTAGIFERAFGQLHRYRADKAPFAAWLFTIARNAVNQQLRTQKRRRWLSLSFLGEDEHTDTGPQPGELVEFNELQAQLLSAFTKLDERSRDVIALKFGSRLTNRRIAEITGFTESNVGVILYRAMQKLRLTLDK